MNIRQTFFDNTYKFFMKRFDYKNILCIFVPHFEVVCALNCKAEP